MCASVVYISWRISALEPFADISGSVSPFSTTKHHGLHRSIVQLLDRVIPVRRLVMFA